MTWLRRHGWKILLGETGLLFLIGAADLVAVYASDPAIPRSVTGAGPETLRGRDPLLFRLTELEVRTAGLNLMAASVVWGSVVHFGLRRGQRWAYLTMWSLPAWIALSLTVRYLTPRAPDTPPPPIWFSGPILLLVAVAVLALGRRTSP